MIEPLVTPCIEQSESRGAINGSQLAINTRKTAAEIDRRPINLT
jgi:hypothetical protein